MTGPLVVFIGTEPVPMSIKDECADQGWEPPRYVQPLRMTAGSGRKLWVVPRVTATDIYIDAHRRRVAILATVKARVRRTPSGLLRDDRVIPVAQFFNYKTAFYENVTTEKRLASWVQHFLAWMSSVGCDGNNDPRCIPFQTFNTTGTYDLNHAVGRSRFELDHHHQDHRRDGRHKIWKLARPNVMHGREPTHVAGFELPPGYHWDVEPTKSPVVVTSDTEWSVNRYINVYPDGIVRPGVGCKQTFSRQDSEKADAVERAKFGKRK